MIIRRIDTFTRISETEYNTANYGTDIDTPEKALAYEAEVEEGAIFELFIIEDGGADKWESKIQLMDGNRVVAEKRTGADRTHL
jgi:hypothetical protein